jgi:excisionase family DNA binding protein
MEADLLRVRDVAARLHLTVGRVYQLIAAGEIPATRVGGAIRVPRVAWQRWLAEKTEQAEATCKRSWT